MKKLYPAPSGNAPTAARVCALTVIRRVFEDGAWADRALHGEAGRLELDPRERALATRLAYGAVQRRATLDHLIEALAGRPTDRLEPVVLRRAAARPLPAGLPRPRARPRRGRPSPSSSSSRSSPGGAKLVNAVLRRGAREAAAVVAALPDGDARRGRPAPLPSRVDRRALVRRARPRRRPRADGRRQRARRGRAARQHAARRRGRPRGRAARSPRIPATDLPEGARPRRRRSTPSTRRCGSEGLLHAAVARRDGRRARRSTRSPASACSTSAPRPAARRPTSPR